MLEGFVRCPADRLRIETAGKSRTDIGMREQGPVAVDFYSELQTAYVKY